MKHQYTTNTQFKAGTYFVTGTDTDVGKTVCSKALLQAANKQNRSTLAYKPISAGCENTVDGLRNEDALILKDNCSIPVPYNWINPIAYEPPIAPHIAALENEDSQIEQTVISKGLTRLQQKSPDFLLIEGAGGWHLPINNEQLLSGWVAEQKIPVVLVVGLKLGCLNHAILTVESIKQSDLPIAGWIANHLQTDMPYVQQNIATLEAYINAPLIAEIPFLDNVEDQDLSKYICVDFIAR